MFLGNETEPWDLTSGPQWDLCSLVTSEIMTIFDDVSIFNLDSSAYSYACHPFGFDQPMSLIRLCWGTGSNHNS